jgi:hypothetical protein
VAFGGISLWRLAIFHCGVWRDFIVAFGEAEYDGCVDDFLEAYFS